MKRYSSAKMLKNNNRGASGCTVILIILAVLIVLGFIVDLVSPETETETTTVSTIQEKNIDFDTSESKVTTTQKAITTTRTTSRRTTTIVQRDTYIQSYVLNTNTKKFHYPSCSSVNQMADHNKQYVECDRNDLIAQGYSPCGRCHP